MRSIGLLKSYSGYSLVEIMVALGIVAGLTMGLAGIVSVIMKNMETAGVSIIRDQLISELRENIANKRALSVSIHKSANSGFYNCICGVGVCTNHQSPNEDFQLFAGDGFPLSPSFYTAGGLPCDSTAPNCLLQITTKYFAQCSPDFTSADQNPAASCVGAEFLGVSYEISQNGVRPGITVRTMTGNVYVHTAEFKAAVCP